MFEFVNTFVSDRTSVILIDWERSDGKQVEEIFQMLRDLPWGFVSRFHAIFVTSVQVHPVFRFIFLQNFVPFSVKRENVRLGAVDQILFVWVTGFS